MQASRSLRSLRVPLAVVAGAGVVGLLANSRKRKAPERPTTPTPASTQQPATLQQGPANGAGPNDVPASGAPAEGGEGQSYPRPTPTGPMVAVYLDDKAVGRLRGLYPDAREARLRKVVLQYGPSEEERNVYEPLFGGTATVKLTGEASSAGRRALAASVSFAGGAVEPSSLSSALDVTPGDQGGGPLGSVVLIEQMKLAGAIKKASWKGKLPPMLVHHRHFPREEGQFKRLEEPITLKGSICRSDWVDGASTRCRTTADEGEERRGWSPSGCSLCNTLRSSPCCDIFARWEALSELVSQAEKESGEDGQDPSRDGTGGSEGESVPASEEAEPDEEPPPAGESGEGVEEEDGDGNAAEEEAEDARRKLLMEDMVAATMELRSCIDFHDVFVDAEADAGADEEPDEDATKQE